MGPGHPAVKQDYLQMRVLEVAPQVFASGPLFATDLSLLARQKVRSILNLRPDDEAEDQPSSDDLARAAGEYGIAYVHFPIDAAALTSESAAALMQASEGLERPVLVCGRAGSHSIKVWETAESMSDQAADPHA